LVKSKDSSVVIQTTSQSVPSTPSWFGEVTVVAHYLGHLGVLSSIEERVRFARRRFGHYDLIDFAIVLIGYAISGERTLEAFYESLRPFATPFMALFGRERLPHRSTLSRFVAALNQAAVEALRTAFLEDLCARPLEKEEKTGGLWDRQGNRWLIFERCWHEGSLPANVLCPVHPIFHRHSVGWMRSVRRATGGAQAGRDGENPNDGAEESHASMARHVFGVSGAGNGDYRGELRQAVKAISGYVKARTLSLSQAVVRLDGQYGNGAILADLAGLAYVMRGKDCDLLDLPEVQARLAQPPDQETTHRRPGNVPSPL
jgi:hypothetical protein